MSNVCSQHSSLPEFHGGGYGIASAAGEAVYELNPVVVTATRTEKMDVDVPATTTVITAKDIQDKGYVSVFDALEHTVGIDSYNYSAGGGEIGRAHV